MIQSHSTPSITLQLHIILAMRVLKTIDGKRFFYSWLCRRGVLEYVIKLYFQWPIMCISDFSSFWICERHFYTSKYFLGCAQLSKERFWTLNSRSFWKRYRHCALIRLNTVFSFFIFCLLSWRLWQSQNKYWLDCVHISFFPFLFSFFLSLFLFFFYWTGFFFLFSLILSFFSSLSFFHATCENGNYVSTFILCCITFSMEYSFSWQSCRSWKPLQIEIAFGTLN